MNRGMRKIIAAVLAAAVVSTCSAVFPSEQVFAAEKSVNFGIRPSLEVRTCSSTGVQVSWTCVKGAAGYEIYRALPGSKFRRIAVVRGSKKLQYRDEGLKPYQSYYYRIRAYRKDGEKRIYGPCAWAEKASAGLAEELKGFKAYTAGQDYITVGWNPVPVGEGIAVYRSDSEKGVFRRIALLPHEEGSPASEYTDRDVSPGRTYYYRARPYISFDGSFIYGRYTKVRAGKAYNVNPRGNLSLVSDRGSELIFRLDMAQYGFDTEVMSAAFAEASGLSESGQGKIEVSQVWKNGTSSERYSAVLNIEEISTDGNSWQKEGCILIRPGDSAFLKVSGWKEKRRPDLSQMMWNMMCRYNSRNHVISDSD